MPHVINDDCIECGTCVDECPVGAISVDRKGKTLLFNPFRCIVCEWVSQFSELAALRTMTNAIIYNGEIARQFVAISLSTAISFECK